MNKVPLGIPLAEIKSKLHAWYPGYKFGIIWNSQMNMIEVHVYKDAVKLSMQSFATDISLDVFWDLIIEWMRVIVR
ncbi:MAG TPA: hypothetical protein VNU45_18140 [Rummeliibacillus sp.]|nr:hypothetical protein [Rummeliibacillus sp.]